MLSLCVSSKFSLHCLGSMTRGQAQRRSAVCFLLRGREAASRLAHNQ
jgi:hypothetical protein